MKVNYCFGSDNHSGIHPDILKAIENANKGYEVAYGDDIFTRKAIEKLKDLFGKNIDVFFVGNGTAANILGLKTVTNSFNTIICAETAHLHVHECCGPEKFIGCKLITIKTSDGKVNVDIIKPHLIGFGDVHMAQPKVISITQATEYGTVYEPSEIKAISDFAHKNNMLLHMDGARLCNAAAFLKKDLNSISGKSGVDILSFGGTKNGMMLGDAVIFFNKNLSRNFEYYRKQGMHLTSKMRFISVQFEAVLSDDLWLKNAKHANKMATYLYEKVKGISQIKVTQKVQANAVFATIPKNYVKKIQQKYGFHVFDEEKSEVRWMCSFNTTEEDINKFVDFIKNILKK